MMPEPVKIKQAFIAGCLTFLFFSSDAQTVREYVTKGDRFFERKDFGNALANYLEALHLDPGDPHANFRAGISCFNRQNFREAVRYLEKAYQLNPAVDANIHYHLGMACQEDQQYGKALEHFKALKASNRGLAPMATRKISECLLADSLMRIPSDATVRPLEDGINTPFEEISPIVSPDGNTLIFTSTRSEDGYAIKSSTNFRDVYTARREGAGWGAPARISSTINVRFNEVATALSADGNTLFLYYEDGAGDIYTSTTENGEWTRPVPLNRFVNHPQYRESSACISPDGQQLFFSSNRPGGRGGYDLYVCRKGSNGQWGRPSNLGSAINTRGDEDRPFLHHDGVTLYFSSNGHATLGDSDVFKSTFRDSQWTPPRNLGHPINTAGDDGYIILAQNGTTGYYSRQRRNDRANRDIFHIFFSGTPAQGGEGRPAGHASGVARIGENDKNIVTVLKGSVIDAANTAPLEATITLVDNRSNKTVSRVTTGPSGTFSLTIPYGGNFGVSTQREGYLFNSMNFDLPEFQKYQEIETHILMVKADVGSRVVLRNVFFDTGESTLKPESLTELENVRDLLQQNTGWRIQVNGHTDNIGQPDANVTLSRRRAEAVVRYLVGQGIAPGRLEAKGFGSQKPLVSNDDEKEGRQINRRTEIEIIE